MGRVVAMVVGGVVVMVVGRVIAMVVVSGMVVGGAGRTREL